MTDQNRKKTIGRDLLLVTGVAAALVVAGRQAQQDQEGAVSYASDAAAAEASADHSDAGQDAPFYSSRYRPAWDEAVATGRDIAVVLYRDPMELGRAMAAVPEREYVVLPLPIDGQWDEDVTNGELWQDTSTFSLFRYKRAAGYWSGPWTLEEFLKLEGVR